MLTIVFVIVVSAAVVGSMWMLRNMQPQEEARRILAVSDPGQYAVEAPTCRMEAPSHIDPAVHRRLRGGGRP